MSTRHSDIKVTTVGDSNYYFIELRKHLGLLPQVRRVFHSPFPEIALNAVRKGEANLLIVDLYEVGIEKTIELVKKVRLIDRTVPICLVGTEEDLRKLPGVPLYWKKQFSQFYKLERDKIEPEISEISKDLVLQYDRYVIKLELDSEQQSEKEKVRVPSSIFAISILIGALGLSITEVLPLGITGGSGFLISFIISFSLLSLTLLISELRGSSQLAISLNDIGANEVECPICRNSLIVTTSLYDKEQVSNRRRIGGWGLFGLKGRYGVPAFGERSRGESGGESSPDFPEKGPRWR